MFPGEQNDSLQPEHLRGPQPDLDPGPVLHDGPELQQGGVRPRPDPDRAVHGAVRRRDSGAVPGGREGRGQDGSEDVRGCCCCWRRRRSRRENVLVVKYKE